MTNADRIQSAVYLVVHKGSCGSCYDSTGIQCDKCIIYARVKLCSCSSALASAREYLDTLTDEDILEHLL